jgi:hypothetical protein
VSQMMFLKYGPDFYGQQMRGARAFGVTAPAS